MTKAQLLLISFICFSISCIGQSIDNMNLPKGGVDTIDFTEKHYTIYYTKDQKLYFNGKRLRFWDQISSSILDEVRQPKMNAVSHIIIYTDKDLKYAYIERIRHEIGKVWDGYIHFKSDGLKSNKALSFYINGSAMYGKKYEETDWHYGPKIIFETLEFTGEKKTPELEDQVFWPVFAPWQSNFSQDFFRKDTLRIKRFLKGVANASVIIKGDSLFKYNGKFLKSSENDFLNRIMEENDILFVKTERGVSYGKYFSAMVQIQSRRKLNKQHGVLRKPFILEVPYIFEKELIKEGIRVFR